jgi:hypothetical protein
LGERGARPSSPTSNNRCCSASSSRIGCLAAQRDASAFEQEGILGENQRKIDLLLGDHRKSLAVADRQQRVEQVLDDDRRQTLQQLVKRQDLRPTNERRAIASIC